MGFLGKDSRKKTKIRLLKIKLCFALNVVATMLQKYKTSVSGFKNILMQKPEKEVRKRVQKSVWSLKSCFRVL